VEFLPLVQAVKDPVAMGLLLWATMEIRGLSRKVSKLFALRDDHEKRVTALEYRTGIQGRRPRESPA
jgi:hypothetical protein